MTDPSDAPTDSPDRSPLPWLLAGALALALVALVVTASLVWLDTRPRTDDDGAVGVAQRAVRTLNGLDYLEAEESLDRVLEMATGKYERDYERDRDEIIRNLVDKKLTLTATIPEGGTALEYLGEEKAQVLVAVDVTTTAASGASETQLRRARVVLEWVDDEWLVSDLQEVG
jgi:hypothetical protein